MQREDEKRRLSEQVNRWISTIRDSKTLPTASNPLLESPDWWKPEFVDPVVEEAISGFRKSKQILEMLGEETDSGVSSNSFVLPLGVVLDALPERYIQGVVSPEDRARPIRVFIDDLFDQLAHGAVRVTVARLVFGVPVGLIASMALRDTETKVTLPLKTVVDSVGVDALAEHTAKQGKRRSIEHLPELFTAAPVVPTDPAHKESEGTDAIATLPPGGEASATVAAPVPSAVDTPAVPVARASDLAAPPEPPVVLVAPVAVVPPQAVLPAAAEAVAQPVSEPPAGVGASLATPAGAGEQRPYISKAVQDDTSVPAVASTAAMERLNANGVDLNSAAPEALLTLRGMTPAIAREIVAHRDRAGRFTDVFGLADVPRVGRKTFRKITGMPYSRTHRHRGVALARWLNLTPESAASLPALVRTIAAHPGLSGCVMSDREGLLLAENGVGDQAPVFSAIVPRLVGQMRENIRDLGGDSVNSITIAYNGRLITIVTGGDLYLTVIHSASRLTTRLHQFLRRVALELEWWFSRRGYVVVDEPAAESADHA